MEQISQDPNGAHASPGDGTVQKRARDYGAELKGLSSSPLGDEGNPGEQPIPTSKRRKLSHDSHGDVSNSESLDDGEIVESPPDSHVAPCQSTELEHPLDDNVGSQPMGTFNIPTKTPSEYGETAPTLRTEENSSSIPDTSEEEDPGGPQRRENASLDINYHPQPPLPGWNRGIQLGTRTTFGAKPDHSPLSAPSGAVKTEDEEQEQQTRKEDKRVRSRDPVSSFEASNATWNFPLSAPDVVAPENLSEEDDFWVTLLKDWIVHLVRANGETADRLTYKVVRSGWSLYFTKRMSFLRGTKKHIIATRLAAQNFMASLNKETIESMISDARQAHSGNQLDDNDVNPTDLSLPSNDEESRLLLNRAGNTSKGSLLYSEIREAMQVCPDLSCRFCDSTSHHSFGCPSRRRCDKCRQIGHSSDTCREKLALAADELGGCAFCGADHEDQDCFEIWTSFEPSASNTKKVKSIPAFCYVCGGENHYGPECSLFNKGGKETGRTTWSKATRDIYIDPECEDIALAWVGVDPGQLAKREFHVPGRATRKTHTYFVSSESEEELIHAPVKHTQRRGEIRIASNIGTMNGNGPGQGGGHKHWQPPLPAGPPPPLSDNKRRSFQPASSGTLPPRPQAFAGKQPARGRGGYRGRGRGRGRGR
ncbi:hypothetical protein GGR55DRAFT_639985 [Xylaria sp. FL0064]|nr:hypothetical protein GGR55DRAFT_639985 [Xylaria sp. FL0064]